VVSVVAELVEELLVRFFQQLITVPMSVGLADKSRLVCCGQKCVVDPPTIRCRGEAAPSGRDEK